MRWLLALFLVGCGGGVRMQQSTGVLLQCHGYEAILPPQALYDGTFYYQNGVGFVREGSVTRHVRDCRLVYPEQSQPFNNGSRL